MRRDQVKNHQKPWPKFLGKYKHRPSVGIGRGRALTNYQIVGKKGKTVKGKIVFQNLKAKIQFQIGIDLNYNRFEFT